MVVQKADRSLDLIDNLFKLLCLKKIFFASDQLTEGWLIELMVVFRDVSARDINRVEEFVGGFEFAIDSVLVLEALGYLLEDLVDNFC